MAGVGAARAGATPVPDLPQGTIFTGFATELSDPGGFPPGMNVPCTPTGAHPFPVVLVAGDVVYAPVAEAHGLAFTPLVDLLGE